MKSGFFLVTNIISQVPWTVTTTLFPNIFGSHAKNAGPSAWICTTSYLPNALQSAAKKEELTAASPRRSMVGTDF